MKPTIPPVYGIQELYRPADGPAEIEYVRGFFVFNEPPFPNLGSAGEFLRKPGSFWNLKGKSVV